MADQRPEDRGEGARPRPPAPPVGPALDHPPTRGSLGDVRRRSGLLLVVAVVIGAAAGLGAALGAPEDLWVLLTAVGLTGLVLAAWAAIRAARVRTVLARSPWEARSGRYRVAGWGRTQLAILVLDPRDGGPEQVCGVRAWRWELAALEEGTGTYWVAGDPERWAVASDPGGDVVVPCRVPRWGWWRERLRGWSTPPGQRAR